MRRMGEEVYVVAKYDYAPQDKQELALRKGDRLVLLDDSRQWWRVENAQRQSGYVPSNFVKRCKPSILTSLRNTLGRRKQSAAAATTPSATTNAYTTSTPGSVAAACSPRARRAVTDHPAESLDLLGDGVATVARYSYQARQADELALAKGERVYVLEKSSDGWWRGRKASTGETGWFPSNYMEPSDDGSETYSSAPDSTGGFLDSLTRGGGTGIGSSGYCGGGLLGGGSLTARERCLETVATLYPFTSSNREELSFDKDERLEILEKPAVDPEWWRARNARGEVGLVPRNYVQTLSTDSGFQTTTQTTPESASSSSLSGGGGGPSRGGSGVSGGAPRGPVWQAALPAAPPGPYASREWFFSNITRAECEQMLNESAENGDFIIRESETNVGDYTLTLKAPHRNKHFRIIVDNGTFCIGQQLFEGLDDLVEHYKKHPIYRHANEKLYLVKAFARKSADGDAIGTHHPHETNGLLSS